MKVRKFLCDLHYRYGARGRAKRMYSRSQRVRDAVVRAARGRSAYPSSAVKHLAG